MVSVARNKPSICHYADYVHYWPHPELSGHSFAIMAHRPFPFCALAKDQLGEGQNSARWA